MYNSNILCYRSSYGLSYDDMEVEDHFVDGIKEILEENEKFHLDHRYHCDSCEGECDDSNDENICCWYYETAEDWFYDDYIFNCHTGPNGEIEFDDLSDFWRVERTSYQECTICWNSKDDCDYYIDYDLKENERYLREPETCRKLNSTCPQNLMWCYK